MSRANRVWRRAIPALVWLYSGLHLVKTGVVFAWGNFMGDFLYNFPAPKVALWANRSSIYFESPSRALYGGVQSQRWGYGPLFHLVTMPLLFLGPLRDGYRIWLLVNYAFLVAGCWLLYRLTMAGRPTLMSLTAFGVMVLNYHPLYEAVLARNIEIFEWLLVLGAMSCYAHRRDRLSGLLIGLATMTKFLPGLFLLYFAIKRRWRAFWTAGLTIGIIGALTQPLLGWQHSITLAQLLQKDAPSGFAVLHSNLTVSGAVLRLARLMGFEPYWVPVSQLCLAILSALFVWVLWRLRFSEHWQLEWSLVAIAMITLIPHNQPHYLIFLLIPYAVLLGEVMARLRRGNWRWILLLATSWGLTGWPIPLSLVHRIFGLTIEQLLWLPFMLCGMVLLVGMVVKRLNESIV